MEEQDVAPRIIRQLNTVYRKKGCPPIIMLHVVPETPVREALDTLMQRHDRMIREHVHDVLMGPSRDPVDLKAALDMALFELNVHSSRVQELLAREGGEDATAVEELSRTHQHLMWDVVPSVLMPELKVKQPSCDDARGWIGKFRLVRKIETKGAWISTAVDDLTGTAYVLKSTHKGNISAPETLQSIYREFTYLSSRLEHPNLVKALSLMQNQSHVCLCVEYGGDYNLHQWLRMQPGRRLQPKESLAIWVQVLRGLHYCHDNNVAHRFLALKHVVIQEIPGEETPRCRIIDFHNSTQATLETVSAVVCGRLPCIAPEVVHGNYRPLAADLWSVGIILLETSGGLGSLQRAARYAEAATAATAVESIQVLILRPDCHAYALEILGGVSHPVIERCLAMLLVLDPAERADVADVLQYTTEHAQ